MQIPPSNHAPGEYASLTAMEQALFSGRPEAQALRAYHDKIVSSRQVQRGRRVLAELQTRWPGDQQLLSLYIALSLAASDDAAAMDAIERLMARSTPDDGLLDAALAVRAKIGPKPLDESRQRTAAISLCMIVKDELAGLGACLEAARNAADELIVVDTGSRDRSADIARVFGARVFSYSWDNDFAAARNHSLDRANGDWILILDADEVIAGRDHDTIRQLVAEHHHRPAAFSIETRNYTHVANAVGWQANEGAYPRHEAGLGWFPSRKVRLFPRCPEIRFHYPIHELVDPTVKAAGIPILPCPVPVHHYGHLNTVRNQQKARTYFKLGYAKLDQLGDDLGAIRELAVQAGQLEYWREALTLWRRVLRIDPGFSEAHVNMAAAHWQMDAYARALTCARRAAELAPDLKEAHYNIAVSLMLLGRAAEAARVLKALLVKDQGYLAAHFMLAATLSFIGEKKGSRSLLGALQKTTAGPALAMAVEDLAQRLRRNGRDGYAAALADAARWLGASPPADPSAAVVKYDHHPANP